MSAKVFYRQLGLLTALTALGLFLLVRFPLFQAHQALYWALLLFYILAAVFFFVIGKKTAGSDNKNAFILFVMGAVFIKMLLSMSVLVIYLKFAQPASKYFIIPFLAVYLVYTVFETYFLMKIGRIKPAS
jgi:hypothetical protein